MRVVRMLGVGLLAGAGLALVGLVVMPYVALWAFWGLITIAALVGI
jgi:hypothetical protein